MITMTNAMWWFNHKEPIHKKGKILITNVIFYSLSSDKVCLGMKLGYLFDFQWTWNKQTRQRLQLPLYHQQQHLLPFVCSYSMLLSFKLIGTSINLGCGGLSVRLWYLSSSQYLWSWKFAWMFQALVSRLSSYHSDPINTIVSAVAGLKL